MSRRQERAAFSGCEVPAFTVGLGRRLEPRGGGAGGESGAPGLARALGLSGWTEILAQSRYPAEDLDFPERHQLQVLTATPPGSETFRRHNEAAL